MRVYYIIESMPSHQAKLTNFYSKKQVKTPKVKAPKVKAPQVKAPQVKKTNDLRLQVNKILKANNISTRAEFLTWSSQGGRKGYRTLYEAIKSLQPEHYKSIKTPNDSIRFYAQKQLSGYKKSNKQ